MEIDSFEKEAKKKKIPLLKGSSKKLAVTLVPFDISSLDTVLGGGLPLGRTVLVTGNFGVGKTFFGQLALANFQRRGYTVAYVDTERRFEPNWFSKSGIDLDNLYVGQPNSGENALDTCIFLVEQQFGLVVLDSVAALVPTVELEGTMENSTVASQARLLNKGLRTITGINKASDDLNYRGTAFVMINQMRSGIGPFTSYMLPGGQGQQYFASIILRILRGSYIEVDGKKEGFNMKFTTDKNNLTAPFQQCNLPFRFSGIIDTVGGLVELALELDIIKQKGPYYSLPDGEDRKIMGKQAVVEELKQNSQLFKLIQDKVNEG